MSHVKAEMENVILWHQCLQWIYQFNGLVMFTVKDYYFLLTVIPEIYL